MKLDYKTKILKYRKSLFISLDKLIHLIIFLLFILFQLKNIKKVFKFLL